MADSVFYDLQDGLKIIVHHESNLVATMIGCQFDLIKYDQDCPSHAFSMTGGTTQVGNVLKNLLTNYYKFEFLNPSFKVT